jgi:hypothetical protein
MPYCSASPTVRCNRNWGYGGSSAETDSLPNKAGNICKLIILIGVSCTATQAIAQKTTGIWYEIWYTSAGDYIWADGHGVGSTRQLVGDVNGDCRADAVVFWDNWNNGSWYVAVSDGHHFTQPARWASAFGSNADDVFLADADGDGDVDAVVFYADSGQWWVARSNRSGFGRPELWIDGH